MSSGKEVRRKMPGASGEVDGPEPAAAITPIEFGGQPTMTNVIDVEAGCPAITKRAPTT
jgi:hypothetical protein